MNLEKFIKDTANVEIESENDAIVKSFFETYQSSSIEDKNVILLGIAEKVESIKARIMASKLESTVISIKDYCDARKVSRQYVYQEIKRGKFKTIELPIFVEYLGEKINVGNQKFLAF